MTYLLLTLIYISFISLGLPDSLLGSAWPTMQADLSVPLSYASYISMLMSVGTVISSLMSDRLIKKFGTGRLTAFSVALTAVTLFGYSVSHSYVLLLILAVPNGLGAGGIDAALNNYVALNFSSRHMSWLHCMWGVGTVVGPYIMGYTLSRGATWNATYRTISVIQIILAIILFVSLPIWKSHAKSISKESESETPSRSLSLREIFALPGATQFIFTFFCYCALEITPIVWSGSYLVYTCGFSVEKAASLSSMFFIGITLGRAVGGFLTYNFSDKSMIRIGCALIAIGTVILILPFGKYVTLAGLLMIGLGCAPIYPAIMHSTPDYFGRENSGALIGVQMASAYTGFCIMPPIFGIIADKVGVIVFPAVLAALLILLFVMHERLIKKVKK